MWEEFSGRSAAEAISGACTRAALPLRGKYEEGVTLYGQITRMGFCPFRSNTRADLSLGTKYKGGDILSRPNTRAVLLP